MRSKKLFCCECLEEMRLPNDCYCRACRNRYARKWRAQRDGRTYIEPTVNNEPRKRLRGTPTKADLERYGK